LATGGYRSAPRTHIETPKSTDVLGYLPPQQLPNSITMLDPPPAAGSEAMARDEAARAAVLPLHGGARYRLAVADANRGQQSTAVAFQCAFGTEINKAATPALYQLLSRVRLDVRAASYPAKSHFNRPRPFVLHHSQPCYASDAQNVRNDGSYPSARAAVGWAYAEVLAALHPARARQIEQRGIEFGRSRIVCDEEWLSDVEASRSIAAVTLKRMYGKPQFRADLDAARKEVAVALRSGRSAPNCRSEALALASASNISLAGAQTAR
jgi:acid phosphatase (class A)